jgi:hypothetical protein
MSFGESRPSGHITYSFGENYVVKDAQGLFMIISLFL